MIHVIDLTNPTMKVSLDASGRFILTGPNDYYTIRNTYAEVLALHKQVGTRKRFKTSIPFWCFGEQPLVRGTVTGIHASRGELLIKSPKPGEADVTDTLTGHVTLSEPGHVTLSEPPAEDVAEYNRLVAAASDARIALKNWRMANATRLGFQDHYVVRRNLEDRIKKEAEAAMDAGVKAEV